MTAYYVDGCYEFAPNVTRLTFKNTAKTETKNWPKLSLLKSNKGISSSFKDAPYISTELIYEGSQHTRQFDIWKLLNISEIIKYFEDFGDLFYILLVFETFLVFRRLVCAVILIQFQKYFIVFSNAKHVYKNIGDNLKYFSRTNRLGPDSYYEGSIASGQLCRYVRTSERDVLYIYEALKLSFVERFIICLILCYKTWC